MTVCTFESSLSAQLHCPNNPQFLLATARIFYFPYKAIQKLISIITSPPQPCNQRILKVRREVVLLVHIENFDNQPVKPQAARTLGEAIIMRLARFPCQLEGPGWEQMCGEVMHWFSVGRVCGLICLPLPCWSAPRSAPCQLLLPALMCFLAIGSRKKPAR